jgi:hypothetical protein
MVRMHRFGVYASVSTIRKNRGASSVALVSGARDDRGYVRTAVTFALMTRANLDFISPDSPIRGLDMPGDREPFSLLLVSTVNGPGFFPFLQVQSLRVELESVIVDLRWLPAVFNFWLAVGLVFDFKLSHPDQWLVKQRWIRIVLFLTLICFGLFLLFVQVWLFREMLAF